MKSIFSSLLIALVLVGCSNGSGGSGDANHLGTSSTGGWFTDTAAQALVEKSAEQLAAGIEIMPDSVFARAPQQWNRASMAAVFRNLDYRGNDERVRNGRSLMLDFDLASNRLVVLKPFYLAFGSLSRTDTADRTRMFEVQKRLLHEFSHLLGRDEAAAAVFSKGFFDQMERFIVNCGLPGGQTLVVAPAVGVTAFLEGQRLDRVATEEIVQNKFGAGKEWAWFTNDLISLGRGHVKLVTVFKYSTAADVGHPSNNWLELQVTPNVDVPAGRYASRNLPKAPIQAGISNCSVQALPDFEF